MKTLQCHSRGDKRYSPFYAKVSVNGSLKSIEEHYQHAKVINGKQPNTWREGKGRRPEAWVVNSLRFGKDETLDGRFNVGVQYYIALWLKHLRANPKLIEYASQFDEFVDPFKGSFPFCQADVIRQAVKHGVESLKPMCQPLLDKLTPPALRIGGEATS